MQSRAEIELIKRVLPYMIVFVLAMALSTTLTGLGESAPALAIRPASWQLASVETPTPVPSTAVPMPATTTTSTTIPTELSAVIPAGAPLPTEAECAAKVVPSKETQPGNSPANHNKGHKNSATNGNWGTDPIGHKYMASVDGNFAGTTDEIIQWGACKWGLDPEIVRAQVMVESSWHQTSIGGFLPDNGTCYDTSHRRIAVTTTTSTTPTSSPVPGTASTTSAPSTTASTLSTPVDPVAGTTTTTLAISPSQPTYECPSAFGLLQLRADYQPGSYPLSASSTAYNVDYALAMERSCFDGHSWVSAQTTGDLWGCIGAFYSGSWHNPPAEAYITKVQAALLTKAWR